MELFSSFLHYLSLSFLPNDWPVTPSLQTLLTTLLPPTAVVTTALSPCPGYSATNIQISPNGLTADLTLAGEACNIYGKDLVDLTLTVEYQTLTRLHVLVQDAAQQVFQVPESVLPRPGNNGSSSNASGLEFRYQENPFSFSILRKANGDVLFDSSAAPLVFEDQYVRLRTSLPAAPSLYGLGEHTDPFMLNTTNYTRTLWNRDAGGTPPGTNLYGAHPVYYDHRGRNGTHGVFLLNSNGMDVKIDRTEEEGQWLEYNTLGGVLDFYFLAGPGPVEVAQQYGEVVGRAAMFPYWGLGFHQCRYGMRDIYEVAGVVYNYSSANIPLETMWTDIDYMELRRVFTLDPARFPLGKVRSLVSYLHERQQHYIVMVDPAVAYQTKNYAPFADGVAADAFLKEANGSIYKGVVWPGVAEFPDWFAPGTQDYWNSEFSSFFDPETGVDIDALWIDMNEASNFCKWPCEDPFAEAVALGNPPRPPPIRIGNSIELPGFPANLQPECHAQVEFSVYAKTFEGENIAVYGDTITLGSTNIWNAPILSADDYPIWTGTIDMPANAKVSYQYVRLQPDGSYVFEDENRTIRTDECSSSFFARDNITSHSPPHDSLNKMRDISAPEPLRLQSRQSGESGNMTGLTCRDLINPAYQIQSAAGSLSNKTIDTDIVHANGLVEYDTHNLYGAMMSEASRQAMLSRRPTLRPLIITRSTFAGSGGQVGHWLGDNSADWDHYRFSISGLLQFASLFQFSMVGSDVCGFLGVTNEHLCARWTTLAAFSPFYRNHQVDGSPPHESYRWPLVAEAARNAIEIRYKLLDYVYTAMYDQSITGVPLVQPMFFHYPGDPQCNALEYQYFWGPGLMVAPVTGDNSTTVRIYLPDDVFYDYYTHEAMQGNGSMIIKQNVPYTSIPLYYKGGNIFAQRASSAKTTTELRKQNFDIVIAPGSDGTASGSLYLDDGVSIEQASTSYINFGYSKNGTFTMTGSFGYQADVNIESVIVLGSSSSASLAAYSQLASTKHEKVIPLTEPFSMDL